MKRQIITIFSGFLLIISFTIGCTEEKEKDGQLSDKLTDEDWDYLVWYYTTSDYLYDFINVGLDITNKTQYNATKSVLLYYLSDDISQNVTNLIEENNQFNISIRIENLRYYFTKVLNEYMNISADFYGLYIVYMYNFDQNNLANYSEGRIVFIGEISKKLGLISNYLEIMSNYIGEEFSDEEWSEWTEGRDWSFLDG